MFSGRSNVDELVLELADLALLEERDELLDLHVGVSDICWSVDLGLQVKNGLKVGESDSRVMFSLGIGSQKLGEISKLRKVKLDILCVWHLQHSHCTFERCNKL